MVHIKAVYLLEKEFKCVKCSYKTFHKQQMNRHIGSKHNNKHKTNHIQPQDYQCGQFSYDTTRKSNLKKHIKADHNYKKKRINARTSR